MEGTPDVRCEFCRVTFESSDELQRHITSEHAGRPFAPSCEICGETFESPADLKPHHSGVHRSGG
jgi:hypothetical protein